MELLNNGSKSVWDIGVRLFHWSLVIVFIIAYLSGGDVSDIHIYTGYIILVLVIFRIIWGFIGTQHARFKDFIYPPCEITNHAKGLFRGKVKTYRGHNPLGGLMVLALLFTLIITIVSGLKVYAEEGYGPLSKSNTGYFISFANASNPDANNDEDSDEEEWWEEVHEFFSNLMIVLIAFHILGVIVSSKIENENLIKAMITGYKKTPEQHK
jgi:cytochrome b